MALLLGLPKESRQHPDLSQIALAPWDVPVHMVLAAELLFSSLNLLKSSLSIKLTRSSMPQHCIYTIYKIQRDIRAWTSGALGFHSGLISSYSKCTCSSSDSYLLLFWNSISPVDIWKTSFIGKSPISHPGLQNIVIAEIFNSNILFRLRNSLMLY